MARARSAACEEALADMAAASQFTIVIPSDLCELPNVQERILAAAREHAFNKEALFAIRLALDEAISNAIRHGNQENPDLNVSIECRVSDERLEVTICDQGPGFTPDQLPDPTLEENLNQPHGRGVMLMEAYMTEVHFNETGNCVTLIKTRSCRKPATA